MIMIGWIVAAAIGFQALRLYAQVQYQQAMLGEMLYDWMFSDTQNAKEVVDILVAHGVPTETVNEYKERYRCLSDQLTTKHAQSVDSTPVINNVELGAS